MNKQIIIIGGGTSIREGIQKRLWVKLNNKYVVGLNYSYKYFSNPTFQSFVDNDFYNENVKDLSKLPLIIGNKKTLKKKLPNTILLPSISKYYEDIKHGVYKASLVGLWALSLVIYLAEEGDKIYLLGYDYGEDKRFKGQKIITHFYQGDIKHRGIGKINYYSANNRAEKDFGCYRNVKKVKIFNVSKISKIPETIFPQLTYEEFFKQLKNKEYNQDILRTQIKNKLKWVKE